MVVKVSGGIRGDEQTGIESVVSNAASVGTSVGSIAGSVARGFASSPSQKTFDEKRPELRGKLHRDLYNAFVDRGVDKEVAKLAADGVVRGENASNNPAIAEVHRIVSQQKSEPNISSEETESQDTVAVGEDSLSEDSKETVSLEQSVTQPEQENLSKDTEEPSLSSSESYSISSIKAREVSKIDVSQPPEEMSWSALRKKSSEISKATGKEPEGRKKKQVLAFVKDFYSTQAVQKESVLEAKGEGTQQDEDSDSSSESNQKKESQTQEPQGQYTSASVSTPIEKTPVVRQNIPALEKDYNAGLKAANVDSATSAQAAADLVAGLDETSSDAIKSAHDQIQHPPRSALQQMYYEVLAKQDINPELVEKASKDLSEGKGALSSDNVRRAHNKILNKELDKTVKSLGKKHYLSLSRYIPETTPEKRIQTIANRAADSNFNHKQIEKLLLKYSPDVANLQQKKGGTATANFLQSAASKALDNKSTAEAINRSNSTGQVLASPKAIQPKAKKGIEV